MKALIYFTLTFSMFTILSCTKDPEPINEEELITTLKYILTPVDSGDQVTMTFSDVDGSGGQDPIVFTTGFLVSGKQYTGNLSILNESVKPIQNITTEIQDEALLHQFFYEISGTLAGKLTIKYDDLDSDNNPVGLKTKVTSSSIGTGKINIVLRHEPDKKASGVTTGSIANAGGETDIEVTFDIEVK